MIRKQIGLKINIYMRLKKKETNKIVKTFLCVDEMNRSFD